MLRWVAAMNRGDDATDAASDATKVLNQFYLDSPKKK
jgi:hypothetical protein